MKHNFVKPVAKACCKIYKAGLKNSNWILAILASLGVIGTAYTFTKGTIKAVKICEQKQLHGAKEVIKEVWKVYLPGIGVVIFTTLAILGNAHRNARRLATWAGIYAASKADNDIIREKAREMLGEKKMEALESKVETEKITSAPPVVDEIVETGHGNQLFRFGWTGAYFRACPDYVDLVFKELNQELDENMSDEIEVNWLIDRLKLPPADAGDALWSKADLYSSGYKEIMADVNYTEWVEINGQRETAAVIRLVPTPSYYA